MKIGNNSNWIEKVLNKNTDYGNDNPIYKVNLNKIE